ncbi:ABC transporter ATP-binding protein [Aquipuribacter sp. SD81]|uniref:ABC transporter ATP-binding protein n=1 Tax=Aquipuribacter sp. SD81 TaxID=3127703 RepID=UPI0030186D6A
MSILHAVAPDAAASGAFRAATVPAAPAAAAPPAVPVDARLAAEGLSLGYDGRRVVERLDVRVPTGRVTCVVGANACGKSTLLRGLARLLPPETGRVVLDGGDIARMPTREVARRLGILPQQPVAPDGIGVADLVARGRFPHRSWARPWGRDDDAAVARALLATGTADLVDRHVDELSGGQRQRVWIAMALAQDTDLMLLDEPTTFLDLAHQVEVLDLLAELNETRGRTVVLVLHDLNQAARYSHHLVAMKDGRVVAEGAPADVVTEELVADVFGLRARVVPDPVTGTPMVVPLGRRGGRVLAPEVGAPAPEPAGPHGGAEVAP